MEYRRPQGDQAGWAWVCRLRSAVVVLCAAVVTAACASTSVTPTPSLRSGAPSPTASNGPSPVPVAAGPLLSLVPDTGPDILMEPDGQQTGVLAQTPTTPFVRSSFGNQLFGILNYGSEKDQVPVAIDPDGAWANLGAPVPHDQFVDAMGAAGGGSWALVTVASDCSKASRATLTLGTESGTHVVATLPAVAGEWQLISFNAAGVVLQAITCHLGGTVIASELVNPDTGSVTDLAGVMGAACGFVALSDSGVLLCSDVSGPSETDFKTVDPNGAVHPYHFPVDATYCRGNEAGLGIAPDAISDDARYLAVSDSCKYPGENGARQQLLIIDTTTGAISRGPTDLYLEPEMWLPNDQLVATEPTLSGALPGGTWIVSPDGSTRLLSAAGDAQQTD
jgi:hypothetical protein